MGGHRRDTGDFQTDAKAADGLLRQILKEKGYQSVVADRGLQMVSLCNAAADGVMQRHAMVMQSRGSVQVCMHPVAGQHRCTSCHTV